MLVRFRAPSYGDITMFGDIAIRLLKLMGHSGTVPSAMNAEDIPQAVDRLREALGAIEAEATETPQGDTEAAREFIDEPVSLRNRAFPLIELFEAAAAGDESVIWDKQ